MHIYQSAVTHLNLQSVLRITKYHKPESTSRSPVRYQTQTVLFTLVPMLTMITAFSLMFISTMLLISYFFVLFSYWTVIFQEVSNCLNFGQKYCHIRFSHVSLVLDRRDILDNTKSLWSCIVFGLEVLMSESAKGRICSYQRERERETDRQKKGAGEGQVAGFLSLITLGRLC